ncbi:MAG TPA: FixH family protein [Novimethylophilus sp.]|jgi:nitrogen fixation protein FixH|uniref:FixH family protein n=1 Tax=Novimethylophilus sp. TaxID=2137426 RepID=UPI002F3EF62A
MSFTETLFGGLLAVIALFFLARRLGLSHYWSAILSAALPFLAYLGFSMSRGVGGDVLAIHLVVFMVTAAVLGVFGNMQRKKESMHWAPRLLIAFFIVLAVLMAGFLSIAMNGLPDQLAKWVMPGHQAMHTGFPGAVPHERNQLYEPHLQRLEQQRNLGWKVEVKGFDALRENKPAAVLVSVKDKQGHAVDSAKVTLDLWRMANSADDRRLELTAQGSGSYGIQTSLADAGNWIAEIYIERGQDSYLMQQPITVSE